MKAKPVTQIVAFQTEDGSVHTDYAAASRWALEAALDEASKHDSAVQDISGTIVRLLAEHKATLMPFIKALQ